MPDTPIARTGARQAQSPLPKAAARAARQQLERLATTWSTPELKTIALAVHPGLRRTIARYDPAARTIELRADAVASPRLNAVLVHEAAHAAVCEQHGIGQTRPHGPEWRRLMAAAGQVAESRLDLGRRCLAPSRKDKAEQEPKGQVRYDHWCPVCQSRRPAKKPMRQWRCASCVADGLPGRLEITGRRPKPDRASR